MNEKQWETKAKALAMQQAARTSLESATEPEANALAWPTLAQLRQALVEIDRLLRSAPTPVQQRYKSIDEGALRDLADEAQAVLDQSSLGWLDRDPVEAAAAQARALDRHLFQHRETRGKPTDPATNFLCPATDTHVIPRPLAKPPAVAEVGTLTYRRRGLVWHRLIPREFDGYTIDLHWYRDLSLSFRREDAQVMGALFDGLSLTPDESFIKFVAKAAPCADEDGALAEQVAAAYGGNVNVALWPELTMPPERRKKLAAALKRSALDSAPGQGPHIVGAGSWHEVDDSTVRNRMHILSALGLCRFYHDKSLPLESKTLGIEELEPSYRIPVLIAEDALIAFGICRDFCEAQVARVYVALDVDLVVVPSYGDLKTIRAHRQQAHNLSTDPGTRAFVVQQIVPDEVATSGIGYVLPPEADTAAITPLDMVTPAPLRLYPISFKKV
jgi:hypothetical protein